MKNMFWKEPNYQDEVKNLKNEVSGIVIAAYAIDGINYLDVRGSDDKIYYKTLSSNWTTVSTEEERIGHD